MLQLEVTINKLRNERHVFRQLCDSDSSIVFTVVSRVCKKKKGKYRLSLRLFKPHRASCVEHRTARQEGREAKQIIKSVCMMLVTLEIQLSFVSSVCCVHYELCT